MRKKSECGLKNKYGEGLFFGMGRRLKITKKILAAILAMHSLTKEQKEDITHNPDGYKLELFSKLHTNKTYLTHGCGCIVAPDDSLDGMMARKTKKEINGTNGWLHVADL